MLCFQGLCAGCPLRVRGAWCHPELARGGLGAQLVTPAPAPGLGTCSAPGGVGQLLAVAVALQLSACAPAASGDVDFLWDEKRLALSAAFFLCLTFVSCLIKTGVLFSLGSGSVIADGCFTVTDTTFPASGF